MPMGIDEKEAIRKDSKKIFEFVVDVMGYQRTAIPCFSEIILDFKNMGLNITMEEFKKHFKNWEKLRLIKKIERASQGVFYLVAEKRETETPDYSGAALFDEDDGHLKPIN